ncbi:MAG: hypothetical protein JEZ03_15695 [Bacteroidales bacterium]|nr:hypothetical protein [Bacteroidales bacterium]
MKKLLSIILLVALVFPFTLEAQELIPEEKSEKSDNATFFYLIPQFAIINGYRFDIERTYNQGQKAVVIAPHFYVRSKKDNQDYYSGNNNYNSLVGIGLNVDYKHYLSEKQMSYISVGGGYHYFNSKHDGEAWIENGDELIIVTGEHTQVTNRLNVNTLLGFNMEISDYIYADIYTGMGLKYSMIDSDMSQTYFDEYMWEYSYSGITYIIGVKIGVKL